MPLRRIGAGQHRQFRLALAVQPGLLPVGLLLPLQRRLKALQHELPAGPLHRRRPGPEDVRDVGVPASAAVAVGVRQKQDVRPPASRHRPLSTVDDPLQERPLPVVQPYVIYLPATRSHGLPPHDAPGTAGGHPPDPEGLLVVGVAGIRYQGEHGKRTGINSTLAGY